MTLGDWEENIKAAETAAKRLIAADFAVLCPQLTGRMTGHEQIDHDTWIANDLPWVEVADVHRVREEGEGLSEEGVPDEDGYGLAEDLMTGGATASQVVIVHGREVIVHQGVRVDVFKGAGDGQHVFGLPSHRLGGGQGQNRPETLPPREEAIVHGPVKFGGHGSLPGDKAMQPRLHESPAILEVCL
jgi:hypothetical protein